MKKVLASTLGVIIAASAVSAFAGKGDRENLAQCKSDIESYYGERTRTRLRSIRHSSGESHLRLMVRPRGGENTVIVCSVSRDGASSLATDDGVALNKSGPQEKVSLAY